MLALRLDVDGKTKYYESGVSVIETIVLTIGNSVNVAQTKLNQADQGACEDLLEKNAELRDLKERIELLEIEKEDLEITIDRASRILDC